MIKRLNLTFRRIESKLYIQLNYNNILNIKKSNSSTKIKQCYFAVSKHIQLRYKLSVKIKINLKLTQKNVNLNSC